MLSNAARGMVTRFIGRCGVCEGDYKLLDGKLVHHGYRRPGHGYIVGDCFGVGYKSYEESTAACVDYREFSEKAQESLEDYLARLNAGEVRKLTVYKSVYQFGRHEQVPEVLHADSADALEADKFARELRREISDTKRQIEFRASESARMTRLIEAWVRRPLRTVEEFEREVDAVLAEKRREREAERAARHQVSREKRAALDAKYARWEQEKRVLMDKYRAIFTRLAAASPPDTENARDMWAEMHRAKQRKSYLRFYPGDLGVDAALVKLRLARVVDRNGRERTEYAPSYGTLFREEEMSPNGGYYVWVLDAHGNPLLEGPYGPHDREKAEQLARIGATKGKHDRAVSLGLKPTEKSFELVRQYKAGSGERVL